MPQNSRQNNNTNDSRWPCPFCFHVGHTKIQCRCHISRNHPNINKNSEFNNFSPPIYGSFNEIDEEFIPDVPVIDLAPPSTSPEVVELTCPRCTGSSKVFKGLRGLKSHYVHRHKEFISELNNKLFVSNCFDDEEFIPDVDIIDLAQPSTDPEIVQLPCPRCTGSSKIFKGVRGLKSHYVHCHKEFISELNDKLFVSNIQSSLTLPSMDPNNIVCQRCTSKTKLCKGIQGLRIHYSLVHKEHLSDLCAYDTRSSQRSDDPDAPADVEHLIKKLALYRQSVRVLKRVPKGARILVAKKLDELITECVSANDFQSWLICCSSPISCYKYRRDRRKRISLHP